MLQRGVWALGSICVLAGATRLFAGCSSDDAAKAAALDSGVDAPATSPPVAGPECLPGTGANATKLIGAAGGTLTLDTVTLTIPPGALEADTEIKITSSTNCPPPQDGFIPETPLYQFEPEGLVFAAPATLTIGYPGAPHGAVLEYTTDFGDLGVLATSEDGNSISSKVSHFSDAIVGGFFDTIFGHAVSVDFKSHPQAIDLGGESELSVHATQELDRHDCTITPDVGALPWRFPRDLNGNFPPQATISVHPIATTIYTLTCPTVGLTLTETVTVRDTPVMTLTATESTVDITDKVHLTWSASALNDCTINGNPVDRTGTGKFDVTASPVAPTQIYTLRCLDSTNRVITHSVRLHVTFNNACATLNLFCNATKACCSPAQCGAAGTCCYADLVECVGPLDCCNDKCELQAGGKSLCCTPSGTACTPGSLCCGGGSCEGGKCVAPTDAGTDAATDSGIAEAGTDSGTDSGVDAGLCGANATLVTAPKCGATSTCCVGPRFDVTDPGTSTPGSGRVKDTSSGLTWTRILGPAANPTWSAAKAFCMGLQLRLPTKAEALALAVGSGSTDQKCAFVPCNFEWQWDTWTSDEQNPGTAAYRVNYAGTAYAGTETAGNLGATLCVQ